MKHSLKITLILLAMFFVSQIIGISVILHYPPVHTQLQSVNNTLVNQTSYNLPYGLEPPQSNPSQNIISIIISFALAVVILLLLMKYRVELILRTWFFVVIVLALAVTFYAFLQSFPYASWTAVFIAVILAYLKVFRRDIIAHNITEVLIYPGLAALFVPLLNIKTAVLLFVIISAYDIYAVWHAKFMQKMAKYQIQNLKMFSGFLIPYKLPKITNADKKSKKQKIMVAMLGGGDVVFPIILAGVVLNTWGLLPALFISAGATIALALLFMYSQKGKFYPAMPFISAGCFAGLGLAYLIQFLA